MAAERLAALDASIADNVSDEPTLKLVTVACLLISACAQLYGRSGVPEPHTRFPACAQFLLRCGGAAQQWAVQQVQRGAMRPDKLEHVVTIQVMALESWQLVVCTLLLNASAAAAAAACAPPALLHQWLHQTLASLRVLAPLSWKPGGWVDRQGAWSTARGHRRVLAWLGSM